MPSVRLNVTVPQDVVETLKEMAGSREQSAFIAESVRFYAKSLKRKKLNQELKEGYLATASENKEIDEDFAPTLVEGLDDENF